MTRAHFFEFLSLLALLLAMVNCGMSIERALNKPLEERIDAAVRRHCP